MNYQSTPAMLTLVPKDGIISSNPGIAPDGSRIPGAKATKFALFTADWIQLQNFVAVALKLPISKGDFGAKYGEFDAKNKKAITDCVGAFQKLHDSAEEFGNPVVLAREVQALTGGAKPPSIYGEIVWVANHISNAARTFNFTYAELANVLTPSQSKEQRKQALIEILSGPGGLRDTAIDMEAKATSLRDRLINFSAKIGESQTAINTYAGVSGAVYKEAVAKVGDLGKQMSDLRVQIQKHNDEYIGYAAGAGGGAALIFIFTFGLGWPIALAYGIGMGVGGAEMARRAMENAQKLYDTAKGDLQQKLALEGDLEALNQKIGDIQSKVNAVCDGLNRIVGVWNNQVFRLDAITKSTDLDLMLTYSALNQRLGILDAQNSWQQIAADTSEFTTHAFVQYREDAAKAA